jgi:archaellum component FlaC
MQEKVHGVPPTIKIFEGKAPPTSWFNQNILRYFENQSKIVFLKDVITYVQQLQAEQLQEARPRIASRLQEAFVAMPEKGSATDISNVNLYNSAQGYLKTEIEFMEKLIAILKKGNPALAQKFEQHLVDLKQITRSFPHLSPKELETLTKMFEGVLEEGEKSPTKAQRAFWNTLLRMMQRLMTNNNANIKDFQEEIKELQGRIKMLMSLEEALNKVNQTLKKGFPNSETFLEFIKDLENLANNYGQLNSQQQQTLVNYFQQLSQFKSTKGTPLIEVSADALMQSKIKEFLKLNPHASSAEVAQYIRTFLKESNLQNSPLSFMKSLGDAIEDALDKPGFPIVMGFSGLPLIKEEGKQLKGNDEMLAEVLTSFSPAQINVNNMEMALERFLSKTASETEDSQIKVVAFHTTVQQLKTTQQNLGKAAAWNLGKSLKMGQTFHRGVGSAAAASKDSGDGDGDESLPAQFADAILNHFMPNQEAILKDLAMILELNNMGASFGNILMGAMDGFNQAANNYDFEQSLHRADDGNFKGNPIDFQTQLSDEKTECSKDINEVKSALTSIQSQITQIDNKLNDPNNPPNDDQKNLLNEMKSKLQNIDGNLRALYDPKTGQGQLQKMKDILGRLKVVPVDGKPDEFQVQDSQGSPDWQKTLAQCENDTINGDPGAKPPAFAGGLVNTYGLASTFQGHYSDQSQSQQMKVQYTLTGVSSEWTAVGTSLQILNQMYMALAQAIYK